MCARTASYWHSSFLVFSIFETWCRPVARGIQDGYADAEVEVDMDASHSRGDMEGKEKRYGEESGSILAAKRQGSMTVTTV